MCPFWSNTKRMKALDTKSLDVLSLVLFARYTTAVPRSPAVRCFFWRTKFTSCVILAVWYLKAIRLSVLCTTTSVIKFLPSSLSDRTADASDRIYVLQIVSSAKARKALWTGLSLVLTVTDTGSAMMYCAKRTRDKTAQSGVSNFLRVPAIPVDQYGKTVF